MKVTPLELPGVLRIDLDVFRDDRGWFSEFWKTGFSGLPDKFVQDNVAYSTKGVLRGLHFQQPFPQGKLVTVVTGEIFDVAVDIRADSATRGRYASVVLSPGVAVYIPQGYAHGYQVITDAATVLYKCTDVYHPEAEHSLRWNDPALAIPWPVREPRVSDKDANAKLLSGL